MCVCAHRHKRSISPGLYAGDGLMTRRPTLWSVRPMSRIGAMYDDDGMMEPDDLGKLNGQLGQGREGMQFVLYARGPFYYHGLTVILACIRSSIINCQMKGNG